MYTIVISLVVSFVAFGLSSLLLGWLGAILPALLVAGLVYYLVSRRVAKEIEPAMLAIRPVLEQGKIDEAAEMMVAIKEKYGKWQPLLSGRLDSELGMLDYVRMRFDTALPLLEAGKFQNGPAQMCIALIHHRKGDKEKAYELMADATTTAPKEIILHLVRCTVLSRDGKKELALAAIDQGLKESPDNNHLKNLQKRMANKKKIDVKQFPLAWYQFFPEDRAKQMVMRGRKDGKLPGGVVAPQQRIGAKRAPRR